MTEPPRQLIFDLAPRPALGAEDFLVSASNAAALRLVESWPHWPHHAVVLQGPAQAGKTHLGQVWRLASGADEVAARDLAQADVAKLMAGKALLVENLEQGIGDERVLFHMLNVAREQTFSLLLTSRAQPSEIAIALPDLSSRLKAAPLIAIAPPDEALLKAVLVKHFSDRQLAIEPVVIDYLLPRMERSMAMAEALVAGIDRRAMATHRRVTRVLAADVLAELAGGADTGSEMDGPGLTGGC